MVRSAGRRACTNKSMPWFFNRTRTEEDEHTRHAVSRITARHLFEITQGNVCVDVVVCTSVGGDLITKQNPT